MTRRRTQLPQRGAGMEVENIRIAPSDSTPTPDLESPSASSHSIPTTVTANSDVIRFTATLGTCFGRGECVDIDLVDARQIAVSAGGDAVISLS